MKPDELMARWEQGDKVKRCTACHRTFHRANIVKCTWCQAPLRNARIVLDDGLVPDPAALQTQIADLASRVQELESKHAVYGK